MHAGCDAYTFSLLYRALEPLYPGKELGSRCKDGHSPSFWGKKEFATLLARIGPKHRTDSLAWDMGEIPGANTGKTVYTFPCIQQYNNMNKYKYI